MAGLSNKGLEILRLPDVITTNQALAADLFADQVAPGDIVDVSANTALGRMIGIVAPAQASLWEAIQQIYDSFNPNTATGFALDNLVALSGISRLKATATTAQVVLAGNINTLINTSAKMSSSITQRVFSILTPVSLTPEDCNGVEIGVLVVADSTNYTISYSTNGGDSFTDITYNSGIGATESSILTGLKNAYIAATSAIFSTTMANSRVSIQRLDPFQLTDFTTSANLSTIKVAKLGVAICDVIGPLGEAAYSINTIAVPISGWDSVYNPLTATTGRYEETDEELRERFRNSKFVQAANIIESLIDALGNVDGVTDVIVYENDTDVTDVLGIPAHSFMPIVLGGLNTTIAETIWQNKPTGIRSFGNTTVNIIDSQGLPHAISFRRPTAVPIYITASITDTGGMPGDVAVQIKQHILDYVENMYKVGDDVIYSRFYTPINEVAGFAVNSLFIGTAPSPVGTSNIVIDFDEVATFSVDNIIITVV